MSTQRLICILAMVLGLSAVGTVRTDTSTPVASPSETVAMAAEIRRRRAADLSPEDVEALREASVSLDVVAAIADINDEDDRAERLERALAVLDRLIASKEPTDE